MDLRPYLMMAALAALFAAVSPADAAGYDPAALADQATALARAERCAALEDVAAVVYYDNRSSVGAAQPLMEELGRRAAALEGEELAANREAAAAIAAAIARFVNGDRDFLHGTLCLAQNTVLLVGPTAALVAGASYAGLSVDSTGGAAALVAGLAIAYASIMKNTERSDTKAFQAAQRDGAGNIRLMAAWYENAESLARAQALPESCPEALGSAGSP